MSARIRGGAWRAVLTSAVGVADPDARSALRRIRAQGGQGAEIIRLSDTALEIPFTFPGTPDFRMDLDATLDVNILPANLPPPAIFIADMDSTMIPVECIDELADFAGVKPRVAAITEAAMRGELDFEAAVDARVALLTDLPVSVLGECFESRIALNPGAETLVKNLNAAGVRTALVSGGFTYFTERVAAAAGFQSNQANVLEQADGRLTGKVRRPILGREAKAEALQKLCEEVSAGPERAVAIGDGANDLAMVRMAGLGIAFKAKPALKAEADAILDHSDLTAVLALTGLMRPASVA